MARGGVSDYTGKCARQRISFELNPSLPDWTVANKPSASSPAQASDPR